MTNILIVDDDKDFRFLLKNQLKDLSYKCHEAPTGDRAFEVLAEENIDLVLCDLNLRRASGRDVLIAMKDQFPQIPVIMITGYSNVRTAVEMMQLGAADYLLKPLIPAELAFVINSRLAEKNADQPEAAPAKTASYEDGYVFSPGEFYKQVLGHIDLVAPTNFSVIIYGESGSGKEAFAKEIHKRSARSSKPFLAIDCGALSSELSASILFGHEKGAFTGATETKAGAFEMAKGGTLFLDEITNLSYEIQVSLLRVMQEKSSRRVGGTKDIPNDVRVIVASNKKLWEACKNGEFREDLYHRFNEFQIEIKPLHERPEDIRFYAQLFLDRGNNELRKKITGFTPEAMEALLNYRWPGNLRELNNLVKRCVLITESNEIGIELLPREVIGNSFQNPEQQRVPTPLVNYRQRNDLREREYVL